MCVVPSIIVDEYSSIGHGCDLVTIVPPGHDLRVFSCVLSQPIVCLQEREGGREGEREGEREWERRRGKSEREGEEKVGVRTGREP